MSDQDIQELVSDFKVIINGNPLSDDAALDIVALVVHQDIDAVGMFTIKLMSWDLFKLKITWIDDAQFEIGNTVEIKIGYKGALDTLIKGEITGLEPEFVMGETPLLVVRGHDRRHRLLRQRNTRTFLKMKDSDIAAQVASEAGLTSTTTDSGTALEYVIQHNQTDWEFLKERARRIGYEVDIDDRSVIFRPFKVSDAPALTITADNDLLEFFPRLGTLGQVSDVTVKGWDITKKEAITSKAESPTKALGSSTGPAKTKSAFSASGTISTDRPVFDKPDADKLSAGRLNDIALNYVVGEGVCWGSTKLKAGKVIKIAGIGKRFSGDYYVTSAIHTYMMDQGYRTRFTVRSNSSNG
jgi:phage protein D